MKRILIGVGICLIGFVGGWIGVLTMDWWFNITINIPAAKHDVSSGDAIAIANTYIVFTTIIFTALAIFIALIAYISSQEHTKHRKASEAEFLKDLLRDCQNDEEQRTLIIDSILGNRHTVEKLETKLNEKIRSLVISNLQQMGYNTETEISTKLQKTSADVRQRIADSKLSHEKSQPSKEEKK